MIDIETLKKTFDDSGYKFCPALSTMPCNFRKVFLGENGIKYYLHWYVTTENCHKYGAKDTYYCKMITDNKTNIEFVDDELKIQEKEIFAKNMFNTGLLGYFQKI